MDLKKAEERVVPCPTCNEPSIWSPKNPYRPFCTKRCQLIDLGEWVDERRNIPGESRDTGFSSQSDDEI